MPEPRHHRPLTPLLQDRPWPPVPSFQELDPDFRSFIARSPDEQRRFLAEARRDPERHSSLLHTFLGIVSGYVFGYEDSPLHRRTEDELEIQLQQGKIVLERELLEHGLDPAPVPPRLSPPAAIRALRDLLRDNPSLHHPLFAFIAERASRDAIRTFLRNEVMRNEVVDDEVSLLVPGLQGEMKRAIAANLWDECGRGRLEKFHTYWLRQLLDDTRDWERLVRYRRAHRPWFTQITTNAFNILITRPGLKHMAYGWFLTNESWVAPHFERILAGLDRLGFVTGGVRIYFEAHVKIDPVHTAELLEAMRVQVPPLGDEEAAQVVRGAHLAVAATVAQYDRMLRYLAAITDGSLPAGELAL